MVPKPTPEALHAVLCALHRLCGASTRCHVPPEAVTRKLPPELRGQAARALRRLAAMGLVWVKTHGPGRRSYGLTREGVRLAKQLCGEGD